jgi:hypothetical protein
MKLLLEQIKEGFEKLFQGESIPADDYRIFVNPAGHGGRYYVQLVWDGFDPMSVTSRQVWIWERLRKVMPPELRKHLSMVLARSAKEFIVADEIALREQESF